MVSYFFSWQKLPEDMWPHFAAEFRDNGADGIVLSHACAVRLLDEPDFAGKLHELSRISGLGFSGAHALFGPEWDLSAIDDEHLRKQEKVESSTGIPWLSDIPVLGYLFSSKSTSVKHSELIVMAQCSWASPKDMPDVHSMSRKTKKP